MKRGKTVKIATLSQELAELAEWAEQRVSAVVAEQRTSYAVGEGSKAVELTPGQLLERLGFTNAQLSTPVKNLSGGQKRRLQLLLILLREPNVLILDEPTNDLDTDMLAAIEDLLDSWPGTLLVVSPRPLPDRAGHRSAVRDHRRAPARPAARGRAVPRAAQGRGRGTSGRRAEAPSAAQAARTAQRPANVQLAGADRRNAEKELSSIDRKLERLQAEIAAQHEKLARHDQSDYVGLGALGDELARLEASVADLETRWLEVSEILEG